MKKTSFTESKILSIIKQYIGASNSLLRMIASVIAYSEGSVLSICSYV
jgi:hypothetical protein